MIVTAARAALVIFAVTEQYPTIAPSTSWLERYSTGLWAAAGVSVLVFVAVAVWNRLLSRQVQARTRAVESSERRYRDLIDNASDLIYRTDPFGHFTFVNPVAARVLGYTETELLSMKYFELLRPEWVPRAMDFYQNAAKSREATYLEFPVRTKNGGELWVGQHVRPIATSGHIEGFQGIARDITDRVMAQEDLKAERDFVTAVLDTAPSLVMVLDAKGYLVRFNRACEHLSGVSLADVAGRPMWEMPFLLERDRQAIMDGMERFTTATEPVTLDRVWLDRHGNPHVVEWTVIALRNQAGAPTYLIAVGVDVTTARELDRLKSQFVSMVSHELRTPLTSIRASMQLVTADAMLAGHPEADQLVHVALSNADRLIRIVNDILDMSKIEAGELTVSLHATDPGPLIEESIRAVQGFARTAGVTISSRVPADLPRVMADPDRAIQVLINLFSNAVKHAPAGTSVDVEAAIDGDGVAVSVRDHGPGIPPSKLDAIFEPFTQLDSSDTRRIQGTGLGLTIARALAEKQGGSVRAASREGEGATFTMRLKRG